MAETHLSVLGKSKGWGNEYNVAKRVCSTSMFNNDNFHDGSHQVAAKRRPLATDDAAVSRVVLSFFTCTAEGLGTLFEVVSSAKKTDNTDEYEKSASSDEMGGVPSCSTKCCPMSCHMLHEVPLLVSLLS